MPLEVNELVQIRNLIKDREPIFTKEFSVLIDYLWLVSKKDISTRFFITLVLLNSLRDEFHSIIVISRHLKRREDFIYPLLSLFPQHLIYHFNDRGLAKFKPRQLIGKKITYIKDFNSPSNRTLIKKITNYKFPKTWFSKNRLFSIPQITTITSTSEIKKLSVFNSPCLVFKLEEFATIESTNEYASNQIISKKSKNFINIIQEYISNLDTSFVVEIPYLLLIRDFLNDINSEKDRMNLALFIQLIRAVTFFNQGVRSWYEILGFNAKVLLADPYDLKAILKLCQNYFVDLFQTHLDFTVYKKSFLKTYHDRIRILKNDPDVEFHRISR